MARAILLAGGYGTRLGITGNGAGPGHLQPGEHPKALAPLGGVPIVEILLRQLRDAGFDRVTLCLFWRADLIVEYLGDGSRVGLELEYSVSSRRLGSAGPLATVEPSGEPHLVLNCDLLTSLDFSRVLRAHGRTRPTATVVALERESTLEYGVLELSDDGSSVRRHVERPRVEHLISAGLNVLEADAWRHLAADTYMDMPTLLCRLIDEGATVSPFLMKRDERWIDIGRRDTYGKADEAFRREPHRYLRGPSSRALLDEVSRSAPARGREP